MDKKHFHRLRTAYQYTVRHLRDKLSAITCSAAMRRHRRLNHRGIQYVVLADAREYLPAVPQTSGYNRIDIREPRTAVSVKPSNSSRPINDSEQLSDVLQKHSPSRLSEDKINISDSEDEHNNVAISELQEESNSIPEELSMSIRQNELNINDDEQSRGSHYYSSSKLSEDKINISDSEDEHNNVAISELQEESNSIPEELSMSIRQNELNINYDEQSRGSHYYSSPKLSEDIINISDFVDEQSKVEFANIPKQLPMSRKQNESNLNVDEQLKSSFQKQLSEQLGDKNISDSIDGHNIVATLESKVESDNIPKEPLFAFQSLEHNVGVISSGPEQELEPPDYENQFKIHQQFLLDNIVSLNRDLDRIKTTLRTVNLLSLPDRGVRLQLSVTEKQAEIQRVKEELLKLQSDQIQSSNFASSGLSDNTKIPTATALLVEAPHGFGKKALETHRVQKALTEDAITQLHSSLNKCPGEDIFAENPKYLKTGVSLMPHQKRALAWLMWRESQSPSGGILADDMGLGKTLTMISLVLKSQEIRTRNNSSSDEDSEKENSWISSRKGKMERGGTLVVCPATLLGQWEGEVNSKCKRGAVDVEIYHGSNREVKPRRLARRDIVITTFNLVLTEGSQKAIENVSTNHKKGVLHNIKWERIILDEAHVIRNHKSKTSLAVFQLRGRYRWALTGTPIHNKELDLYSLLKFLKCTPFDDYMVWKRWVDNKNFAGQQRLKTVMNSIMLRRTKTQLQQEGSLQCLPQKEFHLIDVSLDEEESKVYQKVLVFSRTLFAQFLHQKAEKEQLTMIGCETSGAPNPLDPKSQLAAWHQKLSRMDNIKSFEILVLLLRLRQLCCHPSLISSMLDRDNCDTDCIEGDDDDLVSALGRLGLENREELSSSSGPSIDQVVKDNILSSSNPVFNKDRVSSKMKLLLETLQVKVLDTKEKAVIVSQWTGMLELLAQHLRSQGVSCVTLCGSVPVKDRAALVDSINGTSCRPQVMLLSLTAGGVGLNLVGANHLFLFDLHWNPQLEAQACDRVYRVGQTRTVHVYKFVTQETIEQRIKLLQDQKMSLADGVLSGARERQHTKLSLNDLKMLFSV
uniref:Transcription termination factor 2 n=1 Tax=Timema monikensis TaxID=170555 RepID=A0A7R9E0Q2_9NEOP|nr:unnamed protein product [Timema monikensis]